MAASRDHRWRAVSTLAFVLLAASAPAATKIVDVGPGGMLVFVDEESGTATTTVSVGDTVEWRWMSSGHSTTRTDSPEQWDSGVQSESFTFSHTFGASGTFPYHCTPHQFLGMTGTVVVTSSGATTTTTLPSQACEDVEAVASVRATIDAQCDCVGATRHRPYVRCAAGVARRAVKARTLPAACLDTIKRCATQSTCGRPGFMTCCRTAGAVQTCSIKRTATACRAPRGGIACVGDSASCCDACGGLACPAPATTSTTSSPTSTTSTLPSATGACERARSCAGGICIFDDPTACPDGTSALWAGTATGDLGTADMALAICGSDGSLFGTLDCVPGVAACFVTTSVISGSIFSFDGVTLVFNPVVFTDGGSCTFRAPQFGPTMAGDFVCFDTFGFVVSTGTWSASRCP